MAAETALTTGSSALRARGDAAWSFPGSRRRETQLPQWFAVAAAVLAHGVFSTIDTGSSLGAMGEPPSQLETLIPVDVSEPEPEKPEPETEPEQEELPRTPVETTDSLAPVPSDAEFVEDAGDPNAESDEGAPPDEIAAETLTDPFGDSDWSHLSGSGTALSNGRLGAVRRGTLGSRHRASKTLQARDLSRAAIPPHLDPLVQRNFPVAAKLARVDGKVTVSAIIQADGNPTDVRVISVSPRGRGFGETCSRTVHEGPDWKPRLNRDGRPIATKATYTCHFRAPDSPPPSADIKQPTEGTGANRVWTKL